MFIIVLGGGIDLKGIIPDFVYQRLDKAIELYHNKPDGKIVTTGKYSFLYKSRFPPLFESEKMAEYLIQKNIPEQDIFLEKKSQDTIGNAYYLKKDIMLPQGQKEAMVITSHFHLERVKYVFGKVFGSSYRLKFVAVEENLPKNEEEKVVAHQKELLAETQEFLGPMIDGDHEFLKEKLYHTSYYQKPRPAWVVNFVAKGK